MNGDQTQKMMEIKQRLARLKRSKCFVCQQKVSAGFTFHHKSYLSNEKIYSDFDNPLEYYVYLEPLVQATPQRFLLLCHAHHQSVERLKRFSRGNFNRLVRAVRVSK